MTTNMTTIAFNQRLGGDFYARIRDGVVTRMRKDELDAVLTTDPEDVAYLTGFFHHPCERPVAVWLEASGRCLLLVPALERSHAEAQNVDVEIVEYAEFPGLESPFAVLSRHIDSSISHVGHSPTMSFERLAAAIGALSRVQLTPSNLVMQSRFIKQPEEVALHREAARITDAMLVAGIAMLTNAIEAGGALPSEAELAAHVGTIGTGIMYREHENVVVVSFLAGGLVYSGKNSSYPHGLPSGYRISPGDTFMLSLGCAVGGRFVEGERTFIFGEPTAEQTRFHNTIRLAQQVGQDLIRPGALCRDVNEACLAVIRDAGLGGYILHRQGHGIGLGMHEPPWLESGDSTVLLEGMVVSNEPGIYIPGHAGYRISDSMLVTADGATPLTSYPRSLAECTIRL
jgi:Xaa-Pro dipeptidase